MAHRETNRPELGENAITQRNHVNETATKTPFCFGHFKKKLMGKSPADISIRCRGTISVLTSQYCFQGVHNEGLAIESRRHKLYIHNARHSTGKKYVNLISIRNGRCINLLKQSGNCIYHIRKLYILPTQCICVFRMVLTINSDCFPKQH
jgi:hypothetical protein